MYHVFSLFRFFQDLFQGPPGISLCVSPWKSGQGRPPRKQEASHCFTRESRADVAVPSAERRSCPLECRFFCSAAAYISIWNGSLFSG